MTTVVAVSLLHQGNLVFLHLTFDIYTAKKKDDYQKPQPS